MPGRHANTSDYRYGFNGKEMDDEVMGEGNWQDYGMRMYNPRIGRFPNVDPLTKKYPELTPYQFASNTPIQAIDLDGLEAFFVHGTWSTDNTFPALTKSTVSDIFENSIGRRFDWSGFNSDEFRQLAGRSLAEHIVKYRDPGQALTLVGHSHGGNVAIIAINILKNEYNITVDNLLTINTPVREYQLDSDLSTLHYNVFHKRDPVQKRGGNEILIPDNIITVGPITIPIFSGGQKFPKGELGKANQEFESAINIQVKGFQNWNPTNFHDTHQRPEVFGPELRKAKENVEAFRRKVEELKNKPIQTREERPTQVIDKTAVNKG